MQSESQLKRMYGEAEAIEIIDNCDSYVFFGGNNYETARSLSLKLNVPLDEILYLPVGQIVVFRRGQRPVFSTRFDTFNDEFYKEITQTKKPISDQRKIVDWYKSITILSDTELSEIREFSMINL